MVSAIAVGLACCWWAIPLLLLGKYSSPFLGWIESSAVTTSPTSLVASLRGVDHWQAYLGPGEWPGGWILAAAPGAILATTAVAEVCPERQERQDRKPVAHVVIREGPPRRNENWHAAVGDRQRIKQ